MHVSVCGTCLVLFVSQPLLCCCILPAYLMGAIVFRFSDDSNYNEVLHSATPSKGM